MLPEEVERLRGMSMRHAALELKIAPWRMPFLLARGRKLMRQKIDTVQVFPGMAKLIHGLKADGHNLYILSSNTVQNIRPLLQKHKLDTEFIKLYGSAGLFGKANLLRRMLKRQRLNPAETFYIGDEVRDIEAAKRAGIRIIGVTWGYNNEAALRYHKADFIVDKPAEIRALLTK